MAFAIQYGLREILLVTVFAVSVLAHPQHTEFAWVALCAFVHGKPDRRTPA